MYICFVQNREIKKLFYWKRYPADKPGIFFIESYPRIMKPMSFRPCPHDGFVDNFFHLSLNYHSFKVLFPQSAFIYPLVILTKSPHAPIRLFLRNRVKYLNPWSSHLSEFPGRVEHRNYGFVACFCVVMLHLYRPCFAVFLKKGARNKAFLRLIEFML